MPRYAVGIDFGTESGRALLVDVSNGREVATHVHPYADGVIDDRLPSTSDKLPPDFALQNPTDYIAVLKTAVEENAGFLEIMSDITDDKKNMSNLQEVLTQVQGASTQTLNIAGEILRNAEGAPCKRFTRSTILDNQTYITDGTACQQPDGTWAVGELRPRNDGQPVTTN